MPVTTPANACSSEALTSPSLPHQAVSVKLKLAGVLLYVHRNGVGLLGTGAQDVHLDFHTAPDSLCQSKPAFCLFPPS